MGDRLLSAALDDDRLLQIFLFLEHRDVTRILVTTRPSAQAAGCWIAKAAESNTLWAAYAARVFGLNGESDCRGPAAEVCEGSGAWRRAFVLWYAAAREVGLRPGADDNAGLPPVPARWIVAWRSLRRSLSPEIVATLCGPPSPDVLALLKANDLGPVPPAVAGLWRVCDGQRVPMDASLAQELGMPPATQEVLEAEEWSKGMFGGYTVYDHEVSVVLLPFQTVLKLSSFLREKLQNWRKLPTMLAFAASFNFSKIFLVDAAGDVLVWTRRPSPDFERAVPAPAEGDRVEAGGLLRWVEEYARRLEKGFYKMAPLAPERPESLGVRIFPLGGDAYTRCVTRGVEITASCVYMPEHPQGWTYSISFSLVGSPEQRGFKTCQLSQRHWEIAEDGQETQHVRGEGVIGLFPILEEGGWRCNRESDPRRQYNREPGFVSEPFCYQSCTGRTGSMRGSFGGELLFVPGTLHKPTGEPFWARLETFRLVIPDYVY
eukprot:gnl/TRDRNA2_/TRDRNA2_43032_c0_seq1.p1 gnl/TRDRNA2_/TRDRNA2_43032_c0~~gnl/TRDRNA2_/TRDRNA2_43032_c0_seq1.p1  ORF type:complete len:504 (+),score=68.14 gnl/TRDRNA2_/TRDRNA2_43032_c0_seq1:46-1512(+)